jgi:hypothetical protein
LRRTLPPFYGVVILRLYKYSRQSTPAFGGQAFLPPKKTAIL